MNLADYCSDLYPAYAGYGQQYIQCEHDLNSGPTIPWYDQAWFPITLISILVVLVTLVGIIAYNRYQTNKVH